MLVSDAAQQFKNEVAGLGVEIAGGFVGQQQLGSMHHGARDSDPLHLPAGKLMWHSRAEVAEFYQFELLLRAIARVELARQQQGQLYVFQRQLNVCSNWKD